MPQQPAHVMRTICLLAQSGKGLRGQRRCRGRKRERRNERKRRNDEPGRPKPAAAAATGLCRRSHPSFACRCGTASAARGLPSRPWAPERVGHVHQREDQAVGAPLRPDGQRPLRDPQGQHHAEEDDAVRQPDAQLPHRHAEVRADHRDHDEHLPGLGGVPAPAQRVVLPREEGLLDVGAAEGEAHPDARQRVRGDQHPVRSAWHARRSHTLSEEIAAAGIRELVAELDEHDRWNQELRDEVLWLLSGL
mmetsp:Transcript_49004/g.129994  ORF Transcript_49004/g.129994 Transcript_49004/m.129994 type:complete len:249 (+) Transcript_49004:104-850(+)